MPDVRPIKELSKHRFYELYHFSLQYNEYKNKLKDLNGIKAISYSYASGTKAVSDLTSQTAIKRAELSRKVDLIEECVKEADEYLYNYLLEAVTNENVTYNYLQTRKDIPACKNTFYKARHKYFEILDKKLVIA